ncbi:NAD-dependent epimerase/dehydratase family protein [Arthrobacter sp. VKM Ac-2550]|uniref:NAD-dependent epimerase/dehydratase family protein n=1 Tax=Crystallibacter permensis TaxID=1938888 RepID=UPI0022265707|nr:NAD-dependent epimerase/dehydratase family protein [Arthrobacter sp. VKM Ac-2550]MCW2135350.1 Nucleoside-diphosphate-sugar epimerase [Arthrobacter sp. VKM Ac-2550]
MKFVVTGAAGFIGSRLVESLLSEFSDASVVGIDCFTDYYPRSIKEQNRTASSERYLFIEDDLLSADLSFLQGATAIFHQAGQPGVRKSWGQEFVEYTRQNIDLTQRLLEASLEIDTLEAFVYASSSSIYGDAERFPTTEDDLPAPKSPYGVTKLAAEQLASLYAKNFSLPTVSLRYFTVYGPGQRPDMAFNKFIRSALEGRSIEVYGDGEQIREFTHVDDIVKANILAWRKRPAPGSVINLSGGASVSVNEVIEVIRQIHAAPIAVDYQETALGDVRRTGGSTDLAAQLLEWKPSIDIETGLRSEYEWLSAQKTLGQADAEEWA